MKRISIFILLFCNLSLSLYSESVENLLSGFLQNDLQLKKYTITAEKKSLDLKSTKVSNGIIVSLSTGNMKIQSSADRTRLSVSPSVSVGMPSLNGLSVEGKIPVTIDDGEKKIDNASVSASVEIIGNSRKKSKIQVLEAERALLEAERNVRDRALGAEKDFYNNLKSLYNYAMNVLNANEDLFDDSISLKVLTAQGYSKTSASYRQKNLKVESDRRNVREKERIFLRETELFAKKCGVDFTRDDENPYESAVNFLPSSIPECEAVNIFKMDKNSYSKIENAEWNKKIAQLKRDANGNLTLKANGSYIFNNSFLADDDTNSKSDAVEGSLSLSWKGVTASAGVGVPTGSSVFSSDSDSDSSKSFNPYYTFSLSIKPNDWIISSIEKNKDNLDSELETIALNTAEDDYETDLISTTSNFHDLMWSRKSYADEYETYNALESDMSKWLKQGIVTESDYLSARNNKEKARMNILINAVELIIFNDNVKLLFCDYDDKK